MLLPALLLLGLGNNLFSMLAKLAPFLIAAIPNLSCTSVGKEKQSAVFRGQLKTGPSFVHCTIAMQADRPVLETD